MSTPAAWYVVSFTTSGADVAAVHELARFACPARQPVLEVAPLFERGEDLANAVAILDAMIVLEPVAARLAETGRRLEVMLGYSDSAKELGMVSATLRLFDVQYAAGRGGRPPHDVRLALLPRPRRRARPWRRAWPTRAVLAQAAGLGGWQVQGHRAGRGHLRALRSPGDRASRHLEQVTSSVLLATAGLARRLPSPRPPSRAVARALEAPRALASYRSLVRVPRASAEWFARPSPLAEIGGMRLGSRPAALVASRAPVGLADLRAIPWVFALVEQTRTQPAGLVRPWQRPGRRVVVRRGSRRRPRRAATGPTRNGRCSHSLLDNAEMSLAKTDRAIAARYLALGQPRTTWPSRCSPSTT